MYAHSPLSTHHITRKQISQCDSHNVLYYVHSKLRNLGETILILLLNVLILVNAYTFQICGLIKFKYGLCSPIPVLIGKCHFFLLSLLSDQACSHVIITQFWQWDQSITIGLTDQIMPVRQLRFLRLTICTYTIKGCSLSKIQLPSILVSKNGVLQRMKRHASYNRVRCCYGTTTTSNAPDCGLVHSILPYL